MISDAVTIEQADKKRGVSQRAALLMAANALATILSFALPLILVRAMNQAEYGLYRQAFQIMASALNMLNLQVAVSVFYFTARAPGKKLQVIHNLILFYGGVGALVFALFAIWPGWVTLIFQSDQLVPYIPLLGFTIFSWLISSNLEGVPIALGDVRIASALIVLSQLTKALIMVSAVLIFGSLRSILVAAVIQSFLQMVFMVVYVRRRLGRFLAGIDWQLFKAQIGNALPFGVGGIVAIFQGDMHNYFVSHYFPPSTFAVYSIGCFQLPILGMITASFANALNPELARHKEMNDHAGIMDLWFDVVRKLALFYVPVFAVLVVLRREFITALFTMGYLASVPIFAINLITVLLGITVHMHILRLFDSLKYFRLKLYLGLVPVTWAALYFGLRAGGLIGVALAVVSIQLLDAALTTGMVVRELGTTLGDLKPLRTLPATAAASIIAAIVAFFVKAAIGSLPPLVLLLVGGSIFGIVYLIMAFILGAVTEEEKASLRALWSKLLQINLLRPRGVS